MPQAKGVYVVDVPFIDLRDDPERQAYSILKDRVFSIHKKRIESSPNEGIRPEPSGKTGMDFKFDSIWQGLG
jgi:hypothetical protein